MIIANSSPLIALGRLQKINILKYFFGSVYIPKAVYQETVVDTVHSEQKAALIEAIENKTIIVQKTTFNHPFRRKLHSGEKEVINLAIEKQADAILIDDKKARNEIIEIGMNFKLFYTTDLLKGAEKRGLIKSYSEVINQLRKLNIYLPE